MGQLNSGAMPKVVVFAQLTSEDGVWLVETWTLDGDGYVTDDAMGGYLSVEDMRHEIADVEPGVRVLVPFPT